MSWLQKRREMNGTNNTNGHTTNGHTTTTTTTTDPWAQGIWSIGLINSKNGRYITAETFGYKLNANGTSLKKKQMWRLEPAPNGEGVCLRSHLDRYLAVDQYGNVTGDTEEKLVGAVFEVGVVKGGGTWTLRNPSRGYYLGSDSEKLVCTAKTGSLPGEQWTIHLAARPQVTLKSIGRKRYAHLAEGGDEIHVDANVPWGQDTLFTLEFIPATSGYALHTCNSKYLRSDGKLQEKHSPETLFHLEYHLGSMALRSSPTGHYLAPIGSKAVLKTRSHSVTRDELFTLEDSQAQAAFIAALNNRYVSTRQGVDVTANQDEIMHHETFQLEWEPGRKMWFIRTMQDKYWTLESNGGIQASAENRSSLFQLEFHTTTLRLKASNGKYIGAKRSGHLYANCEVDDEAAQFYFYIVNRPTLVLRCEQGYVGLKGNGPRLECNKAGYEVFSVERKEQGVVHLRGPLGKYWTLLGDDIELTDTPTDFNFELQEAGRIKIKCQRGYVSAGKNGGWLVGGDGAGWEF